MSRFRYILLFAGVLLFVVLLCREPVAVGDRTGNGRRPSPSIPVKSDPAVQVVSGVPAATVTAPPVTLPSTTPPPFRSRSHRLLADAELAAESTETGPAGEMVTVRLFRTSCRYPLIRQVLRPLPGGGVRESLMVGDHVMVRLAPDEPGGGGAALRESVAALGLSLRRALHTPHHYLVSDPVPDCESVPALMAQVGRLEGVEVVEPDYVLSVSETTPNDSLYGQLWGMDRIRMPLAWDITTGDQSTVVAVIDSGVQRDHPDLIDNMWVNPGEIADNGVDDDDNGFIDDVHGWNFADDNANVADVHSHGTHVAGTVGARGHNAAGVVGVCWNVSLLPLRFIGANGLGATSDAIDAVYYANALRARGEPLRVINASWGGDDNSVTLASRIQQAGENGILFIAAAGNDGRDLNVDPHYPASYGLSNIITVANSDVDDGLAGSSNYDVEDVDLAAPGSLIVSTVLAGGTGTKSGTSMASPHVAGVAALLFSLYPDVPLADVKQAILDGALPVATLDGKVLTGARLDAKGALLQFRPTLTHDPLSDQMSVGPYLVEVDIEREAFLAPGTLTLHWNNVGTGSTFHAVTMFKVSEGRYQAFIPEQEFGSRVHYWLDADSVTTAHMVLPAELPLTAFSFDVLQMHVLAVAGTPGSYGSVTPLYGGHSVEDGSVMTFTAPAVVPFAVDERWGNAGWEGTGSCSAGGTGTLAEVAIESASSLTWLWQHEVSLTTRSSPADVLSDVLWVKPDTQAIGTTAPSRATVEGVSLRFSGWYEDGARFPSMDGEAELASGTLLMSGPRTLEARYLPADQDLDGNGIWDWWEQRYFGTNDVALAGDADEDGFSNLDEAMDATSPLDSSSKPTPPSVVLVSPPSIIAVPGPWEIEADVTDNDVLELVELVWERLSDGSSGRVEMGSPAGDDRYRGEIEVVHEEGESFSCWIEATDGSGQMGISSTGSFAVVYPVIGISPTEVGTTLTVTASADIDLVVSNAGGAPLSYDFEWHWSDDMEQSAGRWQHEGSNDSWHRSQRKAAAGSTAWYVGVETGGVYEDSVDAVLMTPALQLMTNATLTFQHWMRAELDDSQADYYWDGGLVAISTNGGASFEQIDPEGGYPHLITDNWASPFAANTPCYGATVGWQPAEFDLSAFDGMEVMVAFHFGSDTATTDEGWYVDDVSVSQVSHAGWLSLTDSSETTLTTGGAQTHRLVLNAPPGPMADRRARLSIVSDDPRTPSLDIPISLQVRSRPVVAFATNVQSTADGSGEFRVPLRLADPEGDVCEVALEWSTNGVSWLPFIPETVAAGFGTAVRSATSSNQVEAVVTQQGGLVTNAVELGWSSHAVGALPPVLPACLVRATPFDGALTGLTATSAVFMIANEVPAPVPSISLDVITGTWLTNRALTVVWEAVVDSGAPMGEYRVALDDMVTGTGAVITATTTEAAISVPHDGTNWLLSITAVDGHGNMGAARTVGPYWIDTTPPVTDAAVAGFAGLTQPGDFTFESELPFQWEGISDAASGLAGVFVGTDPLAGSNSWLVSTGATVQLTQSVDGAAVLYRLWAVDVAGNIAAPIEVEAIVLSESGDFDGDGLINIDETVSGTDPVSASSVFKLDQTIEGPERTLQLSWPVAAGRHYTLMERSSLGTAGTWTAVAEYDAADATNGVVVVPLSAPSDAQRFYCLKVTQP